MMVEAARQLPDPAEGKNPQNNDGRGSLRDLVPCNKEE